MHDWPSVEDVGVPSPALTAAWLALNVLPSERVPMWAGYWLVAGMEGDGVAWLAGLSGRDAHEVRDALPAALADCGVTVPPSSATAAMVAFTSIARVFAAGKATERWVAQKVVEIVEGAGHPTDLSDLPMWSLYLLDDEWAGGWGRNDVELAAAVRRSCHDQLKRSMTLPG